MRFELIIIILCVLFLLGMRVGGVSQEFVELLLCFVLGYFTGKLV